MNPVIVQELVSKAKDQARQEFAHTMEPMLFSADVFHTLLIGLVAQECFKIACEVEDVFRQARLSTTDFEDKSRWVQGECAAEEISRRIHKKFEM